MIRYLPKKEFIYINEKTVNEHGGNFMPPNNSLHEENLDHSLEAVQAAMFGRPLYPEILDEAAAYYYNVVCDHVFSDVNKRTGLNAALLFLRLNRHDISENVVDDILPVS